MRFYTVFFFIILFVSNKCIKAEGNTLDKDSLIQFINSNTDKVTLYNYYDFYNINKACNNCITFKEQQLINSLKDNQYPVYKMFDRLKDSTFIITEDCFFENENSISEEMTLLLRALYSDYYNFYKSNYRFVDDIYFSVKGTISQQINAYKAIQLLKKYSLHKQDKETQSKILAFEQTLIDKLLNSPEYKNEQLYILYIASGLNKNLNFTDLKSYNNCDMKYLPQSNIDFILGNMKKSEQNKTNLVNSILSQVQFNNALYLFNTLHKNVDK